MQTTALNQSMFSRLRHPALTKVLIMSKLTAILLLVGCLQLSAKSYGQHITISKKNASLQELFLDIYKQSGYYFYCNDELLIGSKKVNIQVKDASIEAVLEICFRDQPLTYTISDHVIVVKSKIESSSPKVDGLIDIKGRVLNGKGEGVAGATILVKGSNRAVSTLDDGTFILKDIESNAVLIVSSIGFESKEIYIKGATNVVIQLHISVNNLDETVVKGYYSTSKRLNTGDINTINSEMIQRQPVSNPLAALESQMPGVQVTQTNGNPGGKFNIQIRGLNSLAQGNEPLYLIDGVPFPNNAITNAADGSNLSENATGFYGQNPFASINPADIESINVLKDADATAIYGSRGANGVILIITKKGKEGKTKLDLNMYTGTGAVTRILPLTNTKQYLSIREEAFKNDNVIKNNTNAYDLLLWDTTRYINWPKLLVGGSSTFDEVNADLSGGTKQTQFLIGSNYHHETSVYPGNFADNRAGLHFSLKNTSGNGKFSFDLSGNFSNDQNDLPAVDVTGFLRMIPDAPNPIDSLGHLNWSENGKSFNNPLSFTKYLSSVTTTNLTGSSILRYQLLPSLSFSTSLGFGLIQEKQINTTPIAAQNPLLNPTGNSYFMNGTYKNWIIEPQFNYTVKFLQNQLTALAGSTIQENTQAAQTIYGYGFINDQLLSDPAAAPNLSVIDAHNTVYHYAAVYARINYDIKNKYIVNLTGRRDGSSRFGNGKQFANFGAVGAGWIFSAEPIVKNHFPFLSFGKIRGSYGITGNDQIGDYQYLNNYLPTVSPYQGQTGYYPSRIYNPDYAWEVNKKLEAAIEIGLLKDHILLTASYFKNISGNQLVAYKLPDQTGFNSIFKNLPATVQNQGWEFLLNTIIFQHTNFSWRTSLNFTISSNKLLKFPGFESSSYTTTYAIGYPLNILKLYHYTGIDNQTGEYTFEDVNQDGSLSTIDQVSIKNLNPQFYGGLDNTLAYKNISISFLFQFVKSQAVFYYNGALTSAFYAPGTTQNQPTAVLDRWQKPGDHGRYQRYATNGEARIKNLDYGLSDASVIDASFIRLKNISLSYNIPLSYLKKVKVEQVKIYMQAQNLFTISNYFGNDPEYGNSNSLPPLRILTAGLQITL